VPVSELLSLPQDAGFYNNYCLSSPTLSVSVTAGTIYSIVLSAKDQIGTAYVGATHYGNYYGGGELWKTDQYGLWQKESSNPEWPVYDMQFRTFVTPEPVPLPAGVWLGICAVSVAGWHLKRQKA